MIWAPAFAASEIFSAALDKLFALLAVTVSWIKAKRKDDILLTLDNDGMALRKFNFNYAKSNFKLPSSNERFIRVKTKDSPE